MKNRFFVGIDEVGRGPLAGPVAVGACLVAASLARRGFLNETFPEVKDSKQLTPEKREAWFRLMRETRQAGKFSYAVSCVSHTLIDRRGLAWALRQAIRRSLAKLSVAPEECLILLDGGLKAPEVFARQKTIIGGDESVPLIALASIAAKVLRDHRMAALAKKYPVYGFEKHKGYGTRAHYKSLKKYGASPIHRRSFLS